MQIRFHARTHKGTKRTSNEDSFLVHHVTARKALTSRDESQTGARTHATRFSTGHMCFAVADGSCGRRAGEIASQLAVESLRTFLENGFGEITSGTIVRAAHYANTEIYKEAILNPGGCSGMGTSLTAACLISDPLTRLPLLEIAQVGDSRAYLIRDYKIELVTKDQTFVQQLVDHGLLTFAEAATHSHRHIILQSLGRSPEVAPVLTCISLNEGDHVVLCSDGLTKHLAAEEIQHFIEQAFGDLARATRSLISEADRRGGSDNITAIVAEFSQLKTKLQEQDTRAWRVLQRAAEAHPLSLQQSQIRVKPCRPIAA